VGGQNKEKQIVSELLDNAVYLYFKILEL